MLLDLFIMVFWLAIVLLVAGVVIMKIWFWVLQK